ncbi:hypothetical protein ROE7235_01068 [Roseibaca ekhonensis]|jgi:hypothetical protein|uniref:Lipoprotein n=1 Tax=Roseinatronobacter ekhonensis TaxID=254356 RepID=A0A3B0MNZ1_9RHOB|nr:hypothetical protein [Roseibaca ekhonensis]SUZ31329.1 hypothetical protein ROE7235_01068 [Roseibaca ekhonensis]
MKYAALLTPMLLMACAADPVCHGRLGAIETQIAERERVLARGYRVQPAQEGKTLVTLCGWPEILCTEPVQQPRRARRVAIDVAAEQDALQELRAEQAALRAQGLTCS